MLGKTNGIILVCILIMSLYAIAQDMVTVRVSREYFTVAHDPRLVPFEDPTMMALIWGFRAGAGPGAILGVVLALVASVGKQPRLEVRDLFPGLVFLVGMMAWSTAVAGLAGWHVARLGDVRLGGDWGARIRFQDQPRFVGVACAHLGSYASGVLGGIGVSLWAGRLRGRKTGPAFTDPQGPGADSVAASRRSI